MSGAATAGVRYAPSRIRDRACFPYHGAVVRERVGRDHTTRASMAKAFLDIDIGDADKHASEVAGCDVAPTPPDTRSVLLARSLVHAGRPWSDGRRPNPKP